MIKGVDTESQATHPELPCLGINLDCQIQSKCLHGIFNSDHLNSNYKKLYQYYERKLSPEELDERHFIQSEKRNLTPFKMSPFARNTHVYRNLPPTPQKQLLSDVGDKNDLEPPPKRVLHSGRMLNYESNNNIEGSHGITLDQKLMEIKFPQRVPNSPYSIKQITPATPISMMMELKTWFKQNLSRVCMIEEIGVSQIVYDFI